MDHAFGFFGLGLWFGLAGPLMVHVGIVVLDKARKDVLTGHKKAFVRFLQFVVYPVTILGLLGVASVIGQAPGSANFFSPGMLLGFAVYGSGFWLHRKYHGNLRKSDT